MEQAKKNKLAYFTMFVLIAILGIALIYQERYWFGVITIVIDVIFIIYMDKKLEKQEEPVGEKHEGNQG